MRQGFQRGSLTKTYWLAQISDPYTGKKLSIMYSVQVYGFEKARQMAIDWRHEQELLKSKAFT